MSLFDDASLVMIPSAYKDGKLYSIKPTDGSGDFTFSRSTAATRVNADGLIESVTDNVPRLDYTDSSCPALKLEPQRTNLIEYKAFDNAYWTKTGSSVVSGFASPSADSPLGAFKLVEDSSSGIHRVKADGISVSANRYNVSVFVKPNGRNEIRVSLANYFSSGTDAYFNLDTKVITYGTRAENGLIETFANGWFRCSFSSTSGELAGPNAFVYIDTALSNSNSYQGDGTSGVYIYGAQLEQGSYATSYIPTYGSGTSVTRALDAMNNSSLGLTDCTFFVDFVPLSSVMGLLDFYDNSNARIFYIAINSVKYLQFNSVQGGTIGDVLGPLTIGDRYKLAFTLNASTGNVTIFINGTKYSTYSTTISSLNKISHVSSFGYYNNTEFNQIISFPTILTDEKAIALTQL
jgi:hypothetical protein